MAEAIEFRTSVFGRIGWLAMALIALVPLTFYWIAFQEGGVSSLLTKHWLVVGCALVILFMCLFSLFYSLWFSIWPSWRIRCDQDGIQFIGLPGGQSLKWSQIESFHIGSTGSFSTFLDLRVLGRRRPYRLNVAGLWPSLHELEAVIRQMVKGGSSDNAA